MKKDFESLDEILNKVLNNKLNINKEINFQIILNKIQNQWENIIGVELSQYTYPSFLKNNILYINTINNVWANELSYMKNTILEKINKVIKNHKIYQIYFKIDPRLKINVSQNNFKNSLSKEEEFTIKKQLDQIDIKDNELKEIFINIMKKAIIKRKKNEN